MYLYQHSHNAVYSSPPGPISSTAADSKDAINGKNFCSGDSGPGLLSLSSAEVVFTNMFDGGRKEKKRLTCD